MKRFISIVVMCCFLLIAMPSFAQQEEQPSPTTPQLKPIKSETLSQSAVAQKFNTLMKVDDEIRAIDTHLQGLGFSPQVEQKGVQNFWGTSDTYKNPANNERLTFTVNIRSYTKPGSKDLMAICQTTISAMNRSQTYSFYLLAPNGNFDAMEEYTIDNNLQVIKANSWWSCIQNYVRNRCGSTCTNALISCLFPLPTIPGYIACIAIRCAGYCTVGSFACCSCNCSWWCRWAAGCCRR